MQYLPIETTSKAQEEAESLVKEFIDQRLVVIKEKDLFLLLEKLKEYEKKGTTENSQA